MATLSGAERKIQSKKIFGEVGIDQKQGSKASILDLSSFVAHLGSTLVVGLGEKLSTSFSILHYNETFET